MEKEGKIEKIVIRSKVMGFRDGKIVAHQIGNKKYKKHNELKEAYYFNPSMTNTFENHYHALRRGAEYVRSVIKWKAE